MVTISGTPIYPDMWYERELQFIENRRGGFSLKYRGYLFTTERRYNNTVNWVCNKNSNSKLRCPARCVTQGNRMIKFGKRRHNHGAVYGVVAKLPVEK